MWSDCLLYLGTDFLVGMRCVVSCGSISFPWLRDSQAYRKMNVTGECISRILALREKLLSFQTDFNLVNAAVVCAVLECISGCKPSSVITEPRYVNFVSVKSFCLYLCVDATGVVCHQRGLIGTERRKRSVPLIYVLCNVDQRPDLALG